MISSPHPAQEFTKGFQVTTLFPNGHDSELPRRWKSLSEFTAGRYNLTEFLKLVTSNSMNTPCSHPRVKIVSRDEDAEYVECEDCREVFESGELRDMEIEGKQDDPLEE